VKTDNTDNMAASLMVNQVKIEFTDKPLTAWGGLATILGKYIEKIHFREWVENNVPIEEKSNKSGGVYEKVLMHIPVKVATCSGLNLPPYELKII